MEEIAAGTACLRDDTCRLDAACPFLNNCRSAEGGVMDVLEQITDVQRLTLRPGDSLVVRMRGLVDPRTAALVAEHVRRVLGIDESAPVLVLEDAMGVDVIAAPGGE